MLLSKSTIQNILKSSLLTAFILYGHLCHGQVSTEGRDFWVGFMNSWQDPGTTPSVLEIYITSPDSTSGTLSVPRDASFKPIKFTVIPGITTVITFPDTKYMPTGSGAIDNKGIHVITDDDVSVFAMNKRPHSADMTGVSPTYTLGNKYMVLSHWEDDNGNNNNNSNAEFVVVSVADGTTVEITPTVTTLNGQHPAGVPFTVVLNEGQIFQIKAHGDLTGTKVNGINTQGGCQNFALFAGNEYTLVGPCVTVVGHDHLYAQQNPIDTWGKEFVTIGLEDHPHGDVIKILASEDNTTVLVNSTTYVLNAGEVKVLNLIDVNNIKADKPVCVGQFCRSQGCFGEHGDPFYIVISPVEQMLKKITFDCPNILNVDRYQLNILTHTTDVPSMQLDNKSIASSFLPVPNNPSYSYAVVHTTFGSHTLLSTGRFMAYVYGFGDHESFGYSAGASLENLNIEVKITDKNGHKLSSDSLCRNDDIVFTPVVNGPNHFDWIFGDGGTKVTQDENPVDYIFKKEGKYVFSLKVSVGNGNCALGHEDTYVKVITVVNPKSKILGPRSVCPNTNNVTYRVKNTAEYTYNWSVSGGTIIHDYGDSVVVNWGASNANAFIKTIATNKLGCVGDPVTLPVKINVVIDPDPPFGPDSLCFDAATGIRYNAFTIPGYIYDWHIDPGQITSGDGTSAVLADWSAYGEGKISFSEKDLNGCSGKSDTLSVFIQRTPSSIATILTDKDTYKIGESITFNIDTDTLYQWVNWKYGDTHILDSVLINPTTHTYACSGLYDVSINVYDTVGVCSTKANGLKQIEILPVNFEMIQVTTTVANDSILQVVWTLENANFLDQALKLNRSIAGSNNWQMISTIGGVTTSLTDKQVNPKTTIYEYQLVNNVSCPDPIQIDPQNSILLKATSENNLNAELNWNPYNNWKNGVNTYELYLKIDKGEFIKIDNTSGEAYHFDYDSAGFDYCFRVKAIENNGNNSFSWSNISCASFVPRVVVYNVITPNYELDEKNNLFTIDNIEFYPSSRLIIYNRWGNKVKEFKGYKNNWPDRNHEDELSMGVYFYVLDLNDKRATQSTLRGTLTVLK